MNKEYNEQIVQLIDKHIPVYFLDFDTLEQMKSIISKSNSVGRIELLIVAYMIGATVEETNELLEILKYPTLYSKKREDAIWIFALTHRMDSMSIIDEIFPQIVDEEKNQRCRILYISENHVRGIRSVILDQRTLRRQCV